MFDIPELDRLSRGGRQQLAGRIEAESLDDGGVGQPLTDQLPGGGVPDANPEVLARGGCQSTVRAEGDLPSAGPFALGGRGAVFERKREAKLPGRQVPELGVSLLVGSQ